MYYVIKLSEETFYTVHGSFPTLPNDMSCYSDEHRKVWENWLLISERDKTFAHAFTVLSKLANVVTFTAFR